MKNCINIYLKKDLVNIKIDSTATQEQIVYSLNKKMGELKKLYKEEKVPIFVSGKLLKNKEIDEVERIIKEKIEVDIDFESPKSLGLSSINKIFDQEIATSETTFHRGSIRSGQKIEAEGSIVIIGDLNAGGEVIAADNIIVLGCLRGLAHAGAKGNIKAIVSAGLLDTSQIRIANIIKQINREEEYIHKLAYVYAEENKIIID